MRNKTGFVLSAAGLCALAMIVVPVWAASGTGKRMHMTMHMTIHMSGMPAMPPRTIERDVCLPPGKFDPQAMQHAMSKKTHNQCNVEHYAKHGNEISYDVMCKAPVNITSHAVVHLAGDGGFTGKMHTTGSAAGHAMSMDSDYTAKRIGSCTYTPPAESQG